MNVIKKLKTLIEDYGQDVIFRSLVNQGCIKFTFPVRGGGNIRVRAILGKNIQDLVRNWCFFASKMIKINTKYISTAYFNEIMSIFVSI